MTDARERQEILDNARYLRNVRPVDPEEIHEYVSSAPHPAVVRQVLRESAYDLGMRERPDGTFVPVEEGPVEVEFDGVAAFPEGRCLRRGIVRLLLLLSDHHGYLPRDQST